MSILALTARVTARRTFYVKLSVMKNLKLAIVDVETTGHSVRHGRIIEIGIVRVEQGRVVKKFNSLIDPEQPVSEFITGLTGITDAHLEKAPTFISIKEKIEVLLDDCIFVAHNAPFDYSFIQSEFRRIGDRYHAQSLCTVRLSRALYPEHRHHNLDSVIERCGIICKNRHRALDDAQAVWDFIKHAQKNTSPKKLSEAVKKVLRPQRL